MENTKYGKRREGRWTPIQAKAQDTRANPNSWETHPVRKRWDIGLLRALSLWIMMMMMMMIMRRRAFSVVGPSAWNDLPFELRSLLISHSSKFYISLRSFFFS